MSQFDDYGNIYWQEVNLPQMSRAVTIFVREITEIDQSFVNMIKNFLNGEEESAG